MRISIGVIFLLLSLNSNAKDIVFEGFPFKKIETNEISSSTSLLTKEQSIQYKVTIKKEGENYYWASRGNLQVIPARSGSYITYFAVTGAGYVRTYSPEALKIIQPALKQMSKEEQEKNFLFFEHLVHQMGSITYYGR